MIDKQVTTMAEAMAGIRDGATVLIGGFGIVGHPYDLIDGLIETGVTDLTIVTNNAGFIPDRGVPKLLGLGRIRRLVCSFPRGSAAFEEQYRAGRIELEIVPQGTLAERIRAAGAGIGAFYTPTAAGTRLAEGKEVREIGGRLHVLEYALPGDVALVEAWQADRWGNLTYRGTGRNFNPIMAMAGKLTIVQSQHMAELGGIEPERVVTPGIFVNRVLHVPYQQSQPADAVVETVS